MSTSNEGNAGRHGFLLSDDSDVSTVSTEIPDDAEQRFTSDIIPSRFTEEDCAVNPFTSGDNCLKRFTAELPQLDHDKDNDTYEVLVIDSQSVTGMDGNYVVLLYDPSLQQICKKFTDIYTWKGAVQRLRELTYQCLPKETSTNKDIDTQDILLQV